MKRTNLIKGTLLLILIAISNLSYSNAYLDKSFTKRNVIISSSNLTCTHFIVWLATTQKQQTRGLMQVRSLAEHTGMLFIYPEERIRAMWMKNTYIPLDMLFIKADGQISSISKKTEPLSLKTIRSEEPVKYVLELAGGVSDDLGLQKNDQILILN
jgi:hypothetical protein